MQKYKLSRLNLIRFALVMSFAVAATVWGVWRVAFAANQTWTGASTSNPNPALRNNFWTNGFNWSNNSAPAAGDDLIFPAGVFQASSVNTFAVGTTFNSITLNSFHTMTGGGIALNSGITSQVGSQISLSSIKLNNTQTFSVPNAGTALTITSAIDTNGTILRLNGAGIHQISGIISGTGQIRKSGTGTAILASNNTYSGNTQVFGGTLIINGSQPNSNVEVLDSATLAGTGTVKGIKTSTTSNSTTTISPGVGGAGILNATGDVSFGVDFPTLLKIDINGRTAGTEHDQLNVTTGFVSLDSSDALLEVTIGSGFTPAAGDTFVIIKKDGTSTVSSRFTGKPEGSSFTVGSTTFLISYRGGDGNDVVLHLPTTRTWDGGGADDNWTTAANWVGDVAPQVGDSLVFPQGAARLSNANNFPAGTTFNSISISGGANSSFVYTINGNVITLNAGVTSSVNGSIIDNALLTPINLNADQTFTSTSTSGGITYGSIGTNGKLLTFTGDGDHNVSGSGVISGAGRIIKSGTGDLFLGGTHTYTGTTSLNSGTLFLFANIASSSQLIITGGRLFGNGTTGALTATGGTIDPGDNGGGTGVLSVVGNASMNSATTFSPLVTGRDNGSSDQLNVTGTVSLGNSILTPVFSAVSGAPPAGTPFIIINNDGTDAVNGTFNNLPEGATATSASGMPFRISYVGGTGNDVTLTRQIATRVWDGGGGDNAWSTAANWVGNFVPAAGDNLEFPQTASRKSNTNTFTADTNFNSIILSGGGYTIGGNAINLTTSLTNNHTGSSNALDLVIRGAAGLINQGGFLTLKADNTYTGTTVIDRGTLSVNGNQPNSSVTHTGGTLRGGGTVGAITATAGSLVPGENNSPLLRASGNVSLSGTLTFQPSLSATASQTLQVTGTVSLGNSLNPTISTLAPPAVGSTIVIISNDGTDAVTGTFNGRPEASVFALNGAQLRISYVGGDGNDVVLTILSLPITRLASGADAGAIQATVDQFRTDLGGANNGVGGSFSSGRREINWDGVPDEFAAPANLPPDFFNVNSPRGAIFRTFGTTPTFQVSMDNDTPPDSDPDQIEFDNLNSAYSAAFQTFSAQRLFTPVSSNVMDVTFFVPGTNTPATVKGFGVVFTDVDAVSAHLEFFDENNRSQGFHFAQTSNNGLSFLGVSFGEGVRISRVRITSGSAVIGGNDSGTVDIVAMDDFIYGEPQPIGPTIGFNASTLSVFENEPSGVATLTLTRTGDTTQPASVEYITNDDQRLFNCNPQTAGVPGGAIAGVATSRCDYSTTVGKLSFAANEASKTFTIPLVDDVHVEGAETFGVSLRNPIGLLLGGNSVITVTITDNDTVAGAANPINQNPFFVRQHYLDFFGRNPDQSEINGWVNAVQPDCPVEQTTPECFDRIWVSGVGFFQSIEFQQKGFFVYRFYKLLGQNRLPLYREFIPDMVSLPGTGNADKDAFAQRFMTRADFVALYPASQTNDQFVDKIVEQTGLTTLNVAQMKADLNNNQKTRAQVLREVVESPEMTRREFNIAWVVMQYFGYLRRDGDPASEYGAWKPVLDANPNNFRIMVNGFINSTEYRQRFGQPNN